MKRRVLPILSVVYLAVAGVIASGYVFGFKLNLIPASPAGYRIAFLAERSGVLIYYYSSSVLPRDTRLFARSGVFLFPIDGHELAHGTSHFEVRNIKAAGDIHYDEYELIFPGWVLIVPLVIFPVLWWRRRRVERANAPGFPVEPVGEISN